MSFEQVQVICGLFTATIQALLIVIRRGHLKHEDSGTIFIAFGNGFVIPTALLLCLYGISPESAEALLKGRHYEVYVALTGLLLLLNHLISLGTLYLRAYSQRKISETAKQDESNVPKKPQ